jgi:hypothetical protein
MLIPVLLTAVFAAMMAHYLLHYQGQRADTGLGLGIKHHTINTMRVVSVQVNSGRLRITIKEIITTC